MSTAEERVKFEILPNYKRESRGTKKRVTIDTNEASGSKEQQQSQHRSNDKKSGKIRNSKDGKKSKEKKEPGPPDNDAENQGFTDWLRSSEGVDMMRLFVMANSVLVVMTVAWPHLGQMFGIIRELIFGEDEY